MLVLSREVGEKILIGEPPHQVVVEVKRIRSHEVRLGIEAPRDIPIVRCDAKDTRPRLRD